MSLLLTFASLHARAEKIPDGPDVADPDIVAADTDYSDPPRDTDMTKNAKEEPPYVNTEKHQTKNHQSNRIRRDANPAGEIPMASVDAVPTQSTEEKQEEARIAQELLVKKKDECNRKSVRRCRGEETVELRQACVNRLVGICMTG